MVKGLRGLGAQEEEEEEEDQGQQSQSHAGLLPPGEQMDSHPEPSALNPWGPGKPLLMTTFSVPITLVPSGNKIRPGYFQRTWQKQSVLFYKEMRRIWQETKGSVCTRTCRCWVTLAAFLWG